MIFWLDSLIMGRPLYILVLLNDKKCKLLNYHLKQQSQKSKQRIPYMPQLTPEPTDHSVAIL